MEFLNFLLGRKQVEPQHQQAEADERNHGEETRAHANQAESIAAAADPPPPPHYTSTPDQPTSTPTTEASNTTLPPPPSASPVTEAVESSVPLVSLPSSLPIDSSSTPPHDDQQCASDTQTDTLTAATPPSASSPSSSSSTASSSTIQPSSSSPASSSVEQWMTLLTIRECFVYPVPPRVGRTPYFAESWGLDKPIATCELRLMAREATINIRLFGADHQLFAESNEFSCLRPISGQPIDLDAFLEPVRDSSRYFVIRIYDRTRHTSMSLGIGFRERVSAFDLAAALQDRIRHVDRHIDTNNTHGDGEGERSREEIEAIETQRAETRLAQYHRDYSLKEGDRIKVTLRSQIDSSKKKKSSGIVRPVTQAAIPVIGPNGKFLLAPPPPPPATQDDHGVEIDAATGQESNPMVAPSAAAPTNLSPNHAPAPAPAIDTQPAFELDQTPKQREEEPADEEFGEFASAQ